MKLNQEMKAAIILALAGISDTLSINQFAMPKLKNSRIYTIKSTDESIDITLNFAKPFNVDNELQEVLEYLSKNEFGINLSNEISDIETLNNTCEILNSYKNIVTSLNGITQKNPYAEKLVNTNNIISEWWNTSSSTTKESRVLAGTCSILYNLSEPYKNAYEISCDDLYYKLIKEIAGFSEFLKEYKEEHQINWDTRKRQQSTQEQVKEESKLLTLATLTQLISCSFSSCRALENTGFFRYEPSILGLETDIPEKIYYMHDREHKDKDLKTLKKNIYTILFNSLGLTNKPIHTMQKAEEYDNLIGQTAGTCYNDKALSSTCEMYQMLYPLMDKHMQTVIETMMLNHASIKGYKIAGLPTINPTDITYDRLGDITDINYEYVTSPNKKHILTEVIKQASKELKKNKKITSTAETLLDSNDISINGITADPEESIQDYLNRINNNIQNCLDNINKIREDNGEPPIVFDNEQDDFSSDEYPDIDADDMEYDNF